MGKGGSVAVNGACLTVVERGGGRMSFDAVPETLARTTIGGWRPGTAVNLERAVRAGSTSEVHPRVLRVTPGRLRPRLSFVAA